MEFSVKKDDKYHINLELNFECPYCGHKEKRHIAATNSRGVEVMLCGRKESEGSCGKEFVLDYEYKLVGKVRKIMDENP